MTLPSACLCSAAENLFEFQFLELVGLSGLATNLETSKKDGKERQPARTGNDFLLLEMLILPKRH